MRALTGTLPGLNGPPEGRCWGGSREVKAALLLHPSRAAFPRRLARGRAPEGTRPFRRRLVTDGTFSGLSVDAGCTPPALGCHQGKGSGPTPAGSPVFSRPGPALAPPTDYTRARPCAPPRKWPEWCNGERRERVRRGGKARGRQSPTWALQTHCPDSARAYCRACPVAGSVLPRRRFRLESYPAITAGPGPSLCPGPAPRVFLCTTAAARVLYIRTG